MGGASLDSAGERADTYVDYLGGRFPFPGTFLARSSDCVGAECQSAQRRTEGYPLPRWSSSGRLVRRCKYSRSRGGFGVREHFRCVRIAARHFK